MPHVFVHGVATRQSPRQQVQVHQRNALFKQLVLPQSAATFDPDWGSDGVKLDAALPWMPERHDVEAFGTNHGQVGNGASRNGPAGDALRGFGQGLKDLVDIASVTPHASTSFSANVPSPPPLPSANDQRRTK